MRSEFERPKAPEPPVRPFKLQQRLLVSSESVRGVLRRIGLDATTDQVTAALGVIDKDARVRVIVILSKIRRGRIRMEPGRGWRGEDFQVKRDPGPAQPERRR